MSEKRQVNGPPARLGRLVVLLAFAILVAAICLLSPGSPLRAAPKPTLLGGPIEVSGIIDTDTTWPNFLAVAPCSCLTASDGQRINGLAGEGPLFVYPFADCELIQNIV